MAASCYRAHHLCPTLPSSQATESDPLFSHDSEAVSSLNVSL